MTKVSLYPELGQAIQETDLIDVSRDDGGGAFSTRRSAISRLTTWARSFLLAQDQNLADVANAATARANIGAGTGDGDMVGSNNLSEITNAAAARSNIGAGTGNGDMLGVNNLSEITVPATARANIDAAQTVHTHAAADVVSGTFANARIAQGNVTQHEAAVNHNALANFSSNQHIPATALAVFDGGGSAVAAGKSYPIKVDMAGTIVIGRIISEQSATITVTVRRAASGSYPGGLASLGTLTLTAGQELNDTALSGWTTGVNAGDTLEVEITANDNGQTVTVALGIDKT